MFNLNGIHWNKKEYYDILVVVGSRCGGFEFYAKQQNAGDFLWLGFSEKSDLDIYIDKKNLDRIFPYLRGADRRNLAAFKTNVNYGYEFPFFKNGVLHLPQDKTYLSLAIRKKMKLTLKERWNLENTPFDIYDKNKNYISTILFKPLPYIKKSSA